MTQNKARISLGTERVGDFEVGPIDRGQWKWTGFSGLQLC